ncbi:NAD(P)H-binding protein [Herbiconiux sp. KACC 21604]|uniref:NAD(P)H-binding protein n=1 Tax=unclassified Herbiconiux TaxID=2618217 RepID=UPI001492A458|nr:NAD(P)H-binding protein [Herbiconiux sp. SALV-R1]QJU52667.1 NAD(P)H-binding protein [Herbiconiux sp. SALV-R1]WPO87563.1 NAD(P)H-binding protein [Herbiconiux sp. KACC 21604]
MIVITGANGTLGSLIVQRALERLPAGELGVSVRDTSKAAAFEAAGVRVRAGDFTDPASLHHAFEGADQVLVVSAAIRGPGALAANNAAIDAAREAGARRVLYTSHQGASPSALFPPHRVHAATELHLAEPGLPFTALRNGFYASTLAVAIGDALATGVIAAPADGPVSWTAHADLAEVAALALADEGVLDGVTPPLTAPELLDLEQVARILSDITGRTIARVVVDDEEWKAAAIARGLAPLVADFSLGMYLAARAGEYAVSDPTLECLLGRPATPARATLDRIVAAAR